MQGFIVKHLSVHTPYLRHLDVYNWHEFTSPLYLISSPQLPFPALGFADPSSLCIVVPFVLEMLSLHYLTAKDKQFWTHALLIFTIIYAVFVTANYVVQLATVIPSKLRGVSEAIRVLEQTPHSNQGHTTIENLRVYLITGLFRGKSH